jgi:hypothetical protein
MRKFILGIVLAATAAVALVATPQAEAQTTYPNVSGLTPFTAECGYLSKPGYLRYRHFVASGEWLTYEAAAQIAADQS